MNEPEAGPCPYCRAPVHRRPACPLQALEQQLDQVIDALAEVVAGVAELSRRVRALRTAPPAES